MDIYLVISIGYIHLLALSMGAKDIVNGNNNRAIGSAGKAAAMAAACAAPRIVGADPSQPALST